MTTDATPAVGDLVHDTITNELYRVDETVPGEEFGEVISANEDVRLLPGRRSAEHLSEVESLGPTATLWDGALVTPHDNPEDASSLLLKWSGGSGLDASFEVHDPEVGSIPCRACDSALVGYFGDLDAWVCADCGERWVESTPTERAIQLASEGDGVQIVAQDGAVDAEVEYVAVDGSSLGLHADGGRVKFGLTPNGTATVEDVIAGSIGTLDISEVTIVHSRDPWSE